MATDDDDDDDDDVEDVKGGRAEGGMRRGVGIDGKGWRCGGRGKCSHNNDVVLFSHSHTLSLCIITALPVHNSASPRNCTIESVPPSLNNFEPVPMAPENMLHEAFDVFRSLIRLVSHVSALPFAAGFGFGAVGGR